MVWRTSCGGPKPCHKTRQPQFIRDRGAAMAEHTSTKFQGPETQEAFLADRLRFWSGFTSASVGTVIFLIVLLIGMGVFLL